MKIKAKDKFAWNQASWCGILLAAMLGTCIFSRPAYADCTPSGPFYSGATNGLSCGAMTNASTNMPALTQTQILESAGAVLVVPGSTNTPEFSDGTGHYTVTRDCPYSSSDVTNLITFQPGGPLWTQNWPTNNPPNPVQCGLPSNLTAPYSAIAYVVGYSSDTNVWQNIFYEVGPCVWDIATTNSVDGSITLSNNSATTIYGYGSQVSLTAASLVSNAVATVTIQSPPGLTNFSYTTNYPAPAVIAEWWTVSGPGTYTNTGSGLSAQFTPTNSVGGVGTATFYVAYQNTLPCTDTNFYTNSVAEGFTVVDILATVNGTTVDLATNTPEFCVGLDVSFTLNGLGALPNGLTATNFQWTLSGTFVNQSNSPIYSDSSPSYTNNPALLTNKTITNCWWVSGSYSPPATDTASVTCDLVYTNGTSPQILQANGLFTMHRPILVNYTLNSAPCNPSPNTGDLEHNPPYLYSRLAYGGPLGYINPNSKPPFYELSENQRGYAPSYSVDIDCSTNFNGSAFITQTLIGYETNSTGGVNTYGTNELDNDEIYPNPNSSPVTVIGGGTNVVALNDMPGLGCSLHTAQGLNFTDYIRFNPDPSGTGIYVTLGIVTWSVSDSSDYDSTANDYTPVLPSGVTTFPYVMSTGSGHTDSSPTTSDTFAHWDHAAHNPK
jgi:hypothetical protein